MGSAIAVAIIAAIPGLLSALVAYLTLRSTNALRAQAAQIHGLVNSNLAAVRHDLAIANARIAALQRPSS